MVKKIGDWVEEVGIVITLVMGLGVYGHMECKVKGGREGVVLMELRGAFWERQRMYVMGCSFFSPSAQAMGWADPMH